jgi:hypothetical protein
MLKGTQPSIPTAQLIIRFSITVEMLWLPLMTFPIIKLLLSPVPRHGLPARYCTPCCWPAQSAGMVERAATENQAKSWRWKEQASHHAVHQRLLEPQNSHNLVGAGDLSAQLGA